MSFDMRLVAYAPNGARLGLLPHPIGFEAGVPLGDIPSLKFEYSTLAPGAEHLVDPCEIALEYSVSGTWVEAPNSRYIRIKRSGDVTDQTGRYSYDCPGYAWQLRKLMMYAPDDLTDLVDGKRSFLSATAGAILMTLMNEGHDRGTLTWMTTDFNTTHDSNGDAWDKVITIYYEPGINAQTVLLNLYEQGVVDWQMSGRTLQLYNADAELGRDLATGTAPVDLRLGRDVTEAPDDGTYEDAASVVMIQGEGSLQVEVVNPSADVPWGRWEQYQGQGGVSDEGTARILANAALERAGQERVQITRGITVEAARWLPLHDYRPGDHIMAPGDGGTLQSLRIRQITLSKDQDGTVGGNVVLNDRFLENEIRLARKTSGILGGSTASGGTGADPAPETPSGRIPAAPEGLVVNPVAFIDADGYARGQITASWGIVNEDVDEVAIDVDGYELFIRKNEVGALWYLIATTQAGDTTATYSPLNVGWEYGFKVRAVSEGNKGEFSATVAKLIPDDVTPPPVPSTPTLSTRLGVIHVKWDGLGTGSVAMPSDFERIRVWMATSSGGTYTAIDSMFIAGSIVVPDQAYNSSRWFRFTSRDRSGNESAPSSTANIATTPLVNTDIIGEIINGANLVDGSVTASEKVVAGTITGGLIQALAINAGHIQANAVTADKIAAGTIVAGHIATNAITADKITAGAITAGKLDADAINGKTITGAFIRTAATGQRLEFAPPSAPWPEIRFHPASGTNYTALFTRDDIYPGEATFEISSGTNSTGSAKAQFVVAAGYNLMRIVEPGSEDANGGFLESAEDYARFGYSDGTSDEQYMQFDGSARTRHFGKWWDQDDLGPTAGIHSGSWVTGSGFGGQGLTYGATMQDNMGPVATVRDGNTTANFFWTLTSSNSTGFTMSWGPSGTSTYTGKATYWWSFRHNGSA